MRRGLFAFILLFSSACGQPASTACPASFPADGTACAREGLWCWYDGSGTLVATCTESCSSADRCERATECDGRTFMHRDGVSTCGDAGTRDSGAGRCVPGGTSGCGASTPCCSPYGCVDGYCCGGDGRSEQHWDCR